jgi:hypothetical protein
MFILLVAYMTVASVLLINLLIAMFRYNFFLILWIKIYFLFDLLSNTFNRLQMDTDCIWKFQHYYLVCHNLTRPSLPPPFIAFSHFWRVTLFFFSQVIKLPWFVNQYVKHKNRAKFSMSEENLFAFFM